MENNKKNNFTKTLLQTNIITKCERRLFHELSKNKPHFWLNPIRQPKPSKRIPIANDLLKELGKDYEQKVYNQIKHLKNAIYNEQGGKIKKLSINSVEFLDIFNSLLKHPNEDFILLEYQYRIPSVFFKTLFPAKNGVKETPVDYGSQRPDILMIGNSVNSNEEKIYELLSNGKFRKIPEDQLDSRFGIGIFDIKKTQERRIGTKHFIEIFYYMWTFALFLKANKLTDKFYVRANFNGIFHDSNQEKIRLITSIQDIINRELITLIPWEESRNIFMKIITKIRKLWSNSPLPIDSTRPNLHQGCGYCQYIEDCKETLGCSDDSNPSDWSVKLIPFTSPSIAEQLIREYKCETVGDLYKKIDTIPVGSVPRPLYPELPFLKLKAESIIKNKFIYPEYDQTHSYAIPRYSPIALNFGVEYDANNDKVFAAGLYLKMFVAKEVRYHKRFDIWWKIWRDALKNSDSFEKICFQLDNIFLTQLPEKTVKKFLSLLRSLKGLRISLTGEKTDAGTEIIYTYSKINQDLTIKSEANLIKDLISKLYYILELCSIIEDYIIVEREEYPGEYIGPITSLFYWGQNELNHFQESIDRNLEYIISDEKVSVYYQRLLLYFSPTDTEVANPYQHKKMYDVQKFAESFVGVPDIINYTWHSIARKLFKLDFSPKFWIPHFNFLDLNNWLRFLSSKLDPHKKTELKNQIRKQQLLKLIMIDQIRYQFQRKGNSAISINSRPINRTTFRRAVLPIDYHAIVYVWHIFSLRTAALEQQETERFRSIFPDYSIGKMVAGRVSGLRKRIVNESLYRYTFTLEGLSSNMKVKEKDSVLLIPHAKRDLFPNFKMFDWKVVIKSMEWGPSINGYEVITEDIRNDLYQQCEDERIPYDGDWYLYPFTFDSWSRKLFNAQDIGFFQRDNLGSSWLGHRLSYLWKIRTNPELYWPTHWDFTSPSIYLFAPELLFNINKLETNQDLLTNIFPAPDPSQKHAIKNSLDNIISAILGPPGTGKSQTIAALIDEYLCRRKKEGRKTTRILVTSSSYAALRVVIDKIQNESRDKDGNLTLSSQTQIVYLHSQGQNPYETNSGCRKVDNLVRKSSGAWTFNGEPRIVTPSNFLEEQLEDNYIIFANAHQLYRLRERVDIEFAFDLICVDEASQLPTSHFMASLGFIHKQNLYIKNQNCKGGKNIKVENIAAVQKLELADHRAVGDLTKVVIVGDHNQLPPVMKILPPKNLEPVISSLFSYYVEGHKIPSCQLKVNYRSHKDIVEFTSSLGFYKDLHAHERNATRLLEGNLDNIKDKDLWIKKILSKEKIVCSIEHNRKFEIGISELEADIVTKLLLGYYHMTNPKNEREEIKFWREKVGVVAPHNAQGRTIIKKLYQDIDPYTHLDKDILMEHLKNSVYSVEKFQGSDRDLIITSIGLSDVDKIDEEADFIFNINRFNVLTSRAKSKLIFISSKEILNFIPENKKLIENVSKFNFLVNKFCNKQIIIKFKNDKKESTRIKFRYRQEDEIKL